MKTKINLTQKTLIILFIVFFLSNAYSAKAQDVKIGEDNDSSQNSISSLKDKEYIVLGINVTGNKKTKEKIILREMELHEGDSVKGSDLQELINKSQQNLLKTSLFNYVTITYEYSQIDNSLFVNIKVEERWYLWPQANITPHNGNLNDWLRDPDLSKIDYCFGIKKYNFRGMKESISLNFRRGFNNITQLAYNDISLDKSRKNMLGISLSILKRNSCVLRNYENVADYVQFENEKNAFKEYAYQLNYTYRPKINTKSIFSVNYSETKICDSVAILNPEYLGNGRTKISTMNMQYLFCIDNRNSVYYPLEGSFLQVTLGKRGFFCDDINTFYTKVDARYYTEVFPRFYFATQAYISASTESTPFYYRESFGTKPNVMAGYEERQISGNSLAYIKTSYKLELIKPHIWHIKKINIPKFNKIHYAIYLDMFANCGYATAAKTDFENHNTMNDSFLGSLGIGLDLVTYYDRMFSVYYTRNIQGDAYVGIGIKTFF